MQTINENKPYLADTNKIRFISHEIRNHISVCDMYSQIIRKNLEKMGTLNPSIENALVCIEKSLRIIDMNITDLRAADCNNIQRIYDFSSVVKKGAELAKAYIDDKEINIKYELITGGNVITDENRLLSVVVNIIKNAIESIEYSGEITVKIYTENNCAIAQISNNGEMIPQEIQDKLFENGFTAKENGNGYGLSICAQYMRSQNGNIEFVKSDKNETVFRIILPLFE